MVPTHRMQLQIMFVYPAMCACTSSLFHDFLSLFEILGLSVSGLLAGVSIISCKDIPMEL